MEEGRMLFHERAVLETIGLAQEEYEHLKATNESLLESEDSGEIETRSFIQVVLKYLDAAFIAVSGHDLEELTKIVNAIRADSDLFDGVEYIPF